MTTITMYDSVHADAIPADAPAAAGYVDGDPQLVSYPGLVARFGTSIPIISITATGTHSTPAFRVRVADVEFGDLTPSTGARWAADEILAGYTDPKPTLYHDVAGGDAVTAALMVGGMEHMVDHFVADWSYKPHLVAGSAATQWANPPASGGDFDISLATDTWLGLAPTPFRPPIIGKGQDMTSLEDDTFLHVWGTITGVVYHWWQFLPGKGTNPADNWFVETLPTPAT